MGGPGSLNSQTQGGGFFGQGTQTSSPEGTIGGGTYDEREPKVVSKASTSVGSKLPGTSEILFLKRLLYLKASIDNETTLNAMSVPFEQEKLRDMAGAEQLMIDSEGVLSAARNSAATYHSNLIVPEQQLAIAPQPPRTAAGGSRPRKHGGLDLMANNYLMSDGGQTSQNNAYRMPKYSNDHIDFALLDS